MKRSEFGAPAVLAVIAFAALACGQPLTTAEQTQTAQAVAASPTAAVAVDTATAAAPTGTPATTATPLSVTGTPDPATLTDTGYTAPDGRPLYAECMQAGAPLPPEIPTPAATQIPLPTVDPAIDPNEGKPTPSPSDLPSFDPRTIAPADTTGWAVRYSNCYGYSIALPPDWSVLTPFHNAGYQQGENGALQAGDGRSTVEIGVYYTPVDYLMLSHQVSLSDREYLLDSLHDVVKDGRPGVEQYVSARDGRSRVYLGYIYSLRPDWYVSIGIWLAAPYDANAAMAARAILDSLRFR